MSAGVEGSESGRVRTGTGLARSSDSRTQPTSAPLPSSSSSAEGAPPSNGHTPSNGHAPSNGHTPSNKHGTPGKHHHVLIDSDEDRWAWRRRIRQNPHQLRIYRVGIGIAGLLLICLGLLTGPLPGPGGIPLVLLGLAVWSSEFEWAYKLRQRFKAEIKRFRGWSTGRQVGFWIVFCAVCGTFGYAYLLVLGVPFWMPDVGATLLEHLPGVHDRG